VGVLRGQTVEEHQLIPARFVDGVGLARPELAAMIANQE